jgi:hypothetical protein
LISFPLDQISLNFFKLIQINTKPYCTFGLGPSVSVSGRPTRARVLLIGRTCLSAAPSPGAVPWPSCQLLLSSVRPTARAWRTSRTPVGFRPLPAGRRSSVSRDPPCSCPASSTHRPRRPTPTAPLSHPPPFKKGPDDAAVPRPPFLFSVLTPSTPPQTSLPSVRPTLGAPLFLNRIPAAVPPSFTRSVSRRPSRFPSISTPPHLTLPLPVVQS